MSVGTGLNRHPAEILSLPPGLRCRPSCTDHIRIKVSHVQDSSEDVTFKGRSSVFRRALNNLHGPSESENSNGRISPAVFIIIGGVHCHPESA